MAFLAIMCFVIGGTDREQFPSLALYVCVNVCVFVIVFLKTLFFIKETRLIRGI